MSKFRSSGSLDSLQAVVTRAARLAEQNDLDSQILGTSEVINQELFESPSEFEMLRVLNSLEPLAKSNSLDRYEKLAKGLFAGASTLEAFFDGEESVMVMVDDINVRNNRLNLLSILKNQAGVLADFSKING